MANLTEYYKARREKELNFFFGEGNWNQVTNTHYTFKHVIDEDTIIIATSNIKVIKDSFVLLVANNKAVYLKNWQVASAKIDGMEVSLVKLSRKFFKVYTFSNDFDNCCFEREESFNDLKEIAEVQEQESYKI